jgi:hypothetical protein
MGANRVRLELTDGRTFDNVMVAGGRFVKVLCQNEILFDASDVVAATDFTNAPPGRQVEPHRRKPRIVRQRPI